ncbi:MAG: carboxypeptidase-like regulatory domain-containing protein [Aestuariibaculum sp.]
MKFYIACIQKLKELVEDTNSKSNTNFVPCASLRVFEATDFEFLSGKLLNTEQFLNSEDISAQLNSLSTDKTYWDIDAQSNLYEYYKLFLEQLQLKKPQDEMTVSIPDKKLLYSTDNEPSEQLLLYNKYLEQYEQLVDELNELYSGFENDTASEDNKTTFFLKVDIHQKKIALLLAEWRLKGLKDTIEKALKNINKLSDYDKTLKLKNKILSDIKNIEAIGIQSMNAYVKLQMVPYNFYKNENAWTSLEVNQSELKSILSRAKKDLKGFNKDIINFDYDETFINKITLNYCIITIKRPWLYKDVPISKYIDSNTKKNIYTYAKKIVLIKDLRVILKENLSQAEKTAIEANNIIKFGPIFMKNQFFLNKTSKESFIKPITNKKIYSSKYAHKVDKKLVHAAPLIMAVNPKTTIKPQTVKDKKATIVSTRLRIVTPKIKPETKPKPLITFNAKSALLYKIKDLNIATIKQSNIHIKISDKLTKDGIYKAELSFKSVNNNFFKEIETDEKGTFSFSLPKGTYNVSIRKNGYKELEFNQAIQENKNINITKILEPQEVMFDSYFLMGIIADKVTL